MLLYIVVLLCHCFEYMDEAKPGVERFIWSRGLTSFFFQRLQFMPDFKGLITNLWSHDNDFLDLRDADVMGNFDVPIACSFKAHELSLNFSLWLWLLKSVQFEVPLVAFLAPKKRYGGQIMNCRPIIGLMIF